MNILYLLYINGAVTSICFFIRYRWNQRNQISVAEIMQPALQHDMADYPIEANMNEMLVPLHPIQQNAHSFYPQLAEDLQQDIMDDTPEGLDETPMANHVTNQTLRLFHQRLMVDNNVPQEIPRIDFINRDFLQWDNMEFLGDYFLLREGMIQPQDRVEFPQTVFLFQKWLNIPAICHEMIPNLGNEPNNPMFEVHPNPAMLAQLVEQGVDVEEVAQFGVHQNWAHDIYTAHRIRRITDGVQNQIGRVLRQRFYQGIEATPRFRVQQLASRVNQLSLWTLLVLFVWFLVTFIYKWYQDRSQTWGWHEEL